MRSACSLPCGRISGGGGEGRPILNLMLVIRSIKIAERPSNQAVFRELPLLESADAHAMASSAGACVSSEKRPIEENAIFLNDHIVERTCMWGNAVMNSCATCVMALRPTNGVPPLIASDPPGEKNAATLVAFWLHHAAA